MMAPAVGNGTLARMSRLETDGERVQPPSGPSRVAGP